MTNAHNIASTFETSLQGMASGIAGAIVADRNARAADRAEAAQLRGLASDIRRARAADRAQVSALQDENARLRAELAQMRSRALRAEAIVIQRAGTRRAG